jgi:hypothetical protein
LVGLEELDQEAEQPSSDDEVNDAGDYGRGGVEEFDVRFENVEVERSVGGDGPEDVVVVRELREEDAEEETCRCWMLLAVV